MLLIPGHLELWVNLLGWVLKRWYVAIGCVYICYVLKINDVEWNSFFMVYKEDKILKHS
jgi:hypothetical protein